MRERGRRILKKKKKNMYERFFFPPSLYTVGGGGDPSIDNNSFLITSPAGVVKMTFTSRKADFYWTNPANRRDTVWTKYFSRSRVVFVGRKRIKNLRWYFQICINEVYAMIIIIRHRIFNVFVIILLFFLSTTTKSTRGSTIAMSFFNDPQYELMRKTILAHK